MPKCSVCSDLDLRVLVPGLRMRRTDFDFEDCIASVQDGCQGCQLIYDGLLAHRGTVQDIRSVALNSFGTNRPLHVTVFMEGASSEVLQFYTLAEEPSPWPIIGAARHISEDSSSDECVELAATWIRECQQVQNCGRTCGVLPTRTLQLNKDQDKVFLFEPEGSKEEGYAALSHCWGEAMPLKTTKENIRQHKTGIPLSSLPKTFRDAVVLCRKLGTKYLWIDSLCIIQDDADDWAKEAGQMAQVYAAADFTIAAHSSSDCTGGLFVRRGNSGPHVSTRVEYNTRDGEIGAVYVRAEPPGSPNGDHLCKDLPHFRASGPSKLSTRGWVFQERVLSRRTLHYTPHELVFECNQGFRCECTIGQPIGLRDAVRFKQKFLSKSKPAGSNSSFPTEDPDVWMPYVLQTRNINIKERNPARDFDWPRVVESFSRLDLTYASDRLPALSGLAESKRRATSSASYRDRYLFGLWQSNLLAGLLWQIGEPDQSSSYAYANRRQPESYAPSWSWASVTGPVIYQDDLSLVDYTDPKRLESDNHLIEILDVRTAPATPNPFGPGAGSITFRCVVAEVSITALPRAFIAASKKAIPGKTECPFGYFISDVSDGFSEVGQESEGVSAKYYFMIVGHLGNETIGRGGNPLGLILRTTGSHCYKRVGFMRKSTYVLRDWLEVAEMSVVMVQ